MSEWKEYKLEELTEPIKDTFNPDGSDDYTYIGLEHIEQETLRLNSIGVSSDVTSNKFLFKANDVLFGKLRPYFRKVVKPQFEGICSTDIWVFRAKKGFYQNYLYYFIANWDFVNTANSGEGGTRMPRADWNFLKTTEWKLPPLPEQIQIASILSSLDDKIDLLHRQNKTLEQLAETLFRQWFVEEAEESWEVGKLGDIAAFFNGKARPKEVLNGTIPIYGGNGVMGYTDKSNYNDISIIIGRVGAYCGSLYLENKKIWVSDNALVTRPKIDDSSYFLFYLLKNLHLNSMAEGSSHPLLTQTLLNSIEIIIPPLNMIVAFDFQVKEFWNKINYNTNQILTLTKLRDTLLPKLMSGEVRVA